MSRRLLFRLFFFCSNHWLSIFSRTLQFWASEFRGRCKSLIFRAHERVNEDRVSAVEGLIDSYAESPTKYLLLWAFCAWWAKIFEMTEARSRGKRKFARVRCKSLIFQTHARGNENNISAIEGPIDWYLWFPGTLTPFVDIFYLMSGKIWDNRSKKP